ncbi:unnamed protein product, partial [Rotaria sp. Silwood1]
SVSVQKEENKRVYRSLERKLQDAQPELKTIDDSNKLIQSSSTHKSSSNRIHDDDDDEELSNSDSDVIQMKVDLTLMEDNICENHLHENKSLENCQPNELN